MCSLLKVSARLLSLMWCGGIEEGGAYMESTIGHPNSVYGTDDTRHSTNKVVRDTRTVVLLLKTFSIPNSATYFVRPWSKNASTNKQAAKSSSNTHVAHCDVCRVAIDGCTRETWIEYVVVDYVQSWSCVIYCIGAILCLCDGDN
jgi:hypothetical protein